jgi:hypothetical protein
LIPPLKETTFPLDPSFLFWGFYFWKHLGFIFGNIWVLFLETFGFYFWKHLGFIFGNIWVLFLYFLGFIFGNIWVLFLETFGFYFWKHLGFIFVFFGFLGFHFCMICVFFAPKPDQKRNK